MAKALDALSAYDVVSEPAAPGGPCWLTWRVLRGPQLTHLGDLPDVVGVVYEPAKQIPQPIRAARQCVEGIRLDIGMQRSQRVPQPPLRLLPCRLVRDGRRRGPRALG